MKASLRHPALSLFILFAWAPCWLALWTLSYWLLNDDIQASLLLPGGVSLALLILLPRRFWPVLLLVPLVLLFWLYQQQLITTLSVLAAPLLSLPVALVTRHYWQRFHLYWQRLSLLLGAAFSNALLALSVGAAQPLATFLASLTGGTIMAPFAWLIWEALYHQHRSNPQSTELASPPLRTSLLIWCSLFFAAGAGAQLTLAPQMERLLLILVFLPNVVMAWRFGWQGGVLAALTGSFIITLARQFGAGFASLTEMELFLTTQALLGMGVGIAVSRQQHLTQHLEHYRMRLESELQARRQLTERLVHAEEETRKMLARELHDEIGQNITAIQIQSRLVTRYTDAPGAVQAAGAIEDMALRIHQVTRQLLRQLRPPVPEEITLHDALEHLITEFAFAERGIDCRMDYRLTHPPQNDTVRFTLYRLVQELLNNIARHASAHNIRILLDQHADTIALNISDDGVGITPGEHKGMGLRGMRERIHALGGSFHIENRQGTHVIVNLPTFHE
ncbi:MASE1 sensor histidine kinase [Enterobacteriaceae bacterium 4M9]|nr:MASE1 sensor histidine kinase [Enterobacteriaceae bacterium 4M9]